MVCIGNADAGDGHLRWMEPLSARQGEYKANDPDAEVRQVLLRGSGPLVQVDRHQPHSAFELAGVVARLSEATLVRERQGDIQAHGDEPVLGIFHGALGC